MNKQEILDEIAKLKERLNELEKMYNSLTPPYKRWRTLIGNFYYFIVSGGEVRPAQEGKTKLDDQYYAIGNYFKTEEEAEFEVERLKVIAELREWATPVDKFDWSNTTENKYLIQLKNDTVGNFWLVVDVWRKYQFCDLVFASEEMAENAIEAVGEERIIKYYFRRKVGTNKNE